MDNLASKITGTLLGTSVGDALGLPYEGLSAARARRLFGDGLLRHRFVFGRGMVSDDTEHTVFVAQALLRSPDDPERFARALAWRLRLWLLGVPAGIGLATLRAILKLWVGFPPRSSGVYSAGNGPAMRSALLGVVFADDPERLRSFVRASSRLTHTDPRAERGALLVALAASYGARHGTQGVVAGACLAWLRENLGDEPDAELVGWFAKLEGALGRGATPAEFAASLGLTRGVGGYVYHTVPAALFVWLRSPGDFRAALDAIIRLGGDTDSTGAIVGALVGATAGADAIPGEWLDGLLEWPRSVAWMRRLGTRLAEQTEAGDGKARGPVRFFWPALVPRNLGFLLVVLLHGFRRLLPPY